ncbi:hypothetical protein K788_0003356 [Paraburkholderia caribensis MBA4]|uniref:Uncharacterized protein n=1 Tax=Paraburkholderia caribensis MBA4 TaxID=1323664 RepID=A0A0P0RCE9_9BURK|nr:hypothetical protein K788_0003356 [Paraburkholderia caribensis MBA4]
MGCSCHDFLEMGPLPAGNRQRWAVQTIRRNGADARSGSAGSRRRPSGRGALRGRGILMRQMLSRYQGKRDISVTT